MLGVVELCSNGFLLESKKLEVSAELV